MNPSPASIPLFVDTHAHLDDPAFELDRDGVIAHAIAAGVRRILNVGYSPARWETTIALATAHPHVEVVLGVHPQCADQWSVATLEQLESTARLSSPVAIGEIGLDFYRDGPPARFQRDAFTAQLDLARRLNLPIVIHQRAAESDLIDVLARYPDLPDVILHSFEGTARLAAAARERRFLVGVGGLAIRASSDPLHRVLAGIPLESILLETDAPYLAPPRSPSRRNAPSNIPLIAHHLAPLWNVTTEHLAAQTTATAERVFPPRTASSSVPRQERP